MPIRNALHDADADAAHDRHAAERERLGEVLHGPGPRRVTGRARTRMLAAFEAHHLACLATFRTRHATVQDYARWRFQHWRGGEVPVVDFEALGSVEETDQLYLRLQAEVRTARLSGLPVGQPPGMTAFNGGDLQFWRRFKAGELLSGSSHAGRGMRVRALVTVSWRDGVWHVCFMQDWTHGGVGVSEVFEDLANSTYQHVLMLAGLQQAARGGVRGWLGRLMPRGWRATALRPGSFRFYEHLPPRWLAGEEFSLVRMRFERGRFGSPRREPYAVIPALLASVRRAASRDTKPRIEDVLPQLPQAGGKPPPSRLPLDRARSGDEDSKGVARRFRRFLIEPMLIVVAGLAGALIEFSYGRMPGDNPVIGAAATAASVAITVGAIMLLMKEDSRGGWGMVGRLAIRCVMVLLCFGIALYGYGRSYCCTPADMPMAFPQQLTFE